MIVIGVFVFFMVVAGAAYVLLFLWNLSKTNGEIKNLIKYLNELKSKSDGNINIYVENFEDIRKKVEQLSTVRDIWNDFEKSLVRVKDAEEEKIYSAAGASEYFSFQNFTQGMSLTFWQGYGGTFTGLGILGTFIGLTAGLSDLNMSSNDVEVLKSGIAELLKGVKFAFATSIVGIFCAIFYGVLHNIRINNFRKNVAELAELIEEMFPRRNAEEWLAKNYLESQEQTNALRNLATDIGQAVGEGLNENLQMLSDQIEEKFVPLFENIHSAVKNLNVGFGDAVGKAFSKQAGSQMENFANSLNKFSEGLQSTISESQQVSKKINENILSALEEMRGTLKAGAEDAANYQRESAKENSTAMYQLAENMRDFAEQQKQMLEQFSKNNTSQIQLATKIFQNSVSNHLQQTLSESKQVTEEMNKNFLSTLDEILKILKTGTDELANRQNKSIQENVETINALTDNLKIFAERQEKMLSKSVAESANQIMAANNLFQSTLSKHNETMEKSYTQMENFIQNIENVLLRIKAATSSLGQTAIPLQQSVNLLKECLRENELATKQFREEISTQIEKLTTATRQGGDNIENLVEGLQEYEENIEQAWLNYENNFNNVGGEIERATNIITQRLKEYNDMMNNGMKQSFDRFDTTVTDTVGLIESLVEELQDTVESIRRKV